MNVIGLLRVKNESRWIRRAVSSILPLCSSVIVFDDHSTDDTVRQCASFERLLVIHSPFEGLNEARDKNFMLEIVEKSNPEWLIMIDGDEELAPDFKGTLHRAMQTAPVRCLSLPVLYLWDREDQVRTDGVYGNFRRESVFQPDGSRFYDRGVGSNFHCGNVPPRIRERRGYVDAPLLHYGYLDRATRLAKYAWYNQRDPGNVAEDRYRHMVVGDEFPADSRFRHGGPLELRPAPEAIERFTALRV